MQTEIYFKNDLTQTCFSNDLGVTDIGDPFVLKTEDGGYYMYCTSAPNGFYCWHSDDLVNWGDKKMCYIRKPDSWCTDCFWAPEVVYRNEQYYMFYTAKNQSGSLRIGLAVSSAPVSFPATPVMTPRAEFSPRPWAAPMAAAWRLVNSFPTAMSMKS